MLVVDFGVTQRMGKQAGWCGRNFKDTGFQAWCTMFTIRQLPSTPVVFTNLNLGRGAVLQSAPTLPTAWITALWTIVIYYKHWVFLFHHRFRRGLKGEERMYKAVVWRVERVRKVCYTKLVL